MLWMYEILGKTLYRYLRNLSPLTTIEVPLTHPPTHPLDALSTMCIHNTDITPPREVPGHDLVLF